MGIRISIACAPLLRLVSLARIAAQASYKHAIHTQRTTTGADECNKADHVEQRQLILWPNALITIHKHGYPKIDDENKRGRTRQKANKNGHATEEFREHAEGQ